MVDKLIFKTNSLLNWLKSKTYLKKDIDDLLATKASKTLASSTSDGLMSKSDKQKLDAVDSNAKSITRVSQLTNDSKYVNETQLNAKADKIHGHSTSEVKHQNTGAYKLTSLQGATDISQEILNQYFDTQILNLLKETTTTFTKFINTTIIDDKYTKLTFTRIGNIVIVEGGIRSKNKPTGSDAISLVTIPDEYRPVSDKYFDVRSEGSTKNARLRFNSNLPYSLELINNQANVSINFYGSWIYLTDTNTYY